MGYPIEAGGVLFEMGGMQATVMRCKYIDACAPLNRDPSGR